MIIHILANAAHDYSFSLHCEAMLMVIHTDSECLCKTWYNNNCGFTCFDNFSWVFVCNLVNSSSLSVNLCLLIYLFIGLANQPTDWSNGCHAVYGLLSVLCELCQWPLWQSVFVLTLFHYCLMYCCISSLCVIVSLTTVNNSITKTPIRYIRNANEMFYFVLCHPVHRVSKTASVSFE